MRKVVFVAIELVVNVMISGVVVEQCMEDVAGKPQPAVVIHRLDGRKREKEYGCSRSHTGEEERESTADGVQNKALKRVVVKSPEGVRDYKSVVLGMDVLIQKLVDVHVSVHEVLPCVHNKHCDDKLQCYHQGGGLLSHGTTVITNDLHFITFADLGTVPAYEISSGNSKISVKSQTWLKDRKLTSTDNGDLSMLF